MNRRLSCYQVMALMKFYLEDKINSKLREYIELHIEKCPQCQARIGELKSFMNEINKKNRQKAKIEADYETINRLSAYMDNELNSNENIKIKKMTISNSKVRKELESLYKFQRALHSAYEKTKNDSKFDYSKNIITKIQDGYEYTTSYFYKIATLFVILLLGIIAGFIYLYF